METDLQAQPFQVLPFLEINLLSTLEALLNLPTKQVHLQCLMGVQVGTALQLRLCHLCRSNRPRHFIMALSHQTL